MNEIKKLEETAQNGDSDAMYELAEKYHYEINADDDDEEDNEGKAIYWYTKAAEAGNTKSMLELGDFYRYGSCGLEEDKEKSLKWYQKAVEAGDFKALDKVGSMYRYGEGVTRDLVEAVKYFIKGAEFGNVDSMNDLADCLLKGIGISKNIDKAIEWYRKAAEAGHGESMNDLATCLLLYKGAETEALEWLKKYSDSDHIMIYFERGSKNIEVYAMEKLARIYYFDMPDTRENKEKAFNWYKKIAEFDLRYGYELGEMYLCGEGVEKNIEEAVKCFTIAAENGNNSSMRELAELYIKGIGVEKSEDKAFNWILKRHDGDEHEAIREMAFIYHRSEDVEHQDQELIDEEKALKYFQKLCELNDGDGFYYIGKMYEDGVVFKQDRSKAFEMFKKGADMNDSGSCRKNC